MELFSLISQQAQLFCPYCKGKAVTLCVSDVFMAHYNKIYSKIDDKTENT